MLGQRHELERESVRRAILEFIHYFHLIYIRTRAITFGGTLMANSNSAAGGIERLVRHLIAGPAQARYSQTCKI